MGGVVRKISMAKRLLKYLLQVILLAAWSIAREIPPAEKAGFNCGMWTQPEETSKGGRHYIVFPSNWAVMRTPTVTVGIQADIATDVQIKHNDAVQGQGTMHMLPKSTKELVYPYQHYTTRKASLVQATTSDIRVHVSFKWVAPNDDVYSFSYWSISRALLGSKYYCITEPARDTQYIGEILILNSEWGNTIVNVRLPKRRPRDPQLQVEYGSRVYVNGEEIKGIAVARDSFVQIQATIGDLSGAYVYADNMVAVWCGNGPHIRTGNNLRINLDATLEQMLPTTAYGTSFISRAPPRGELVQTSRLSKLRFKFVGLAQTTTVRVAERVLNITRGSFGEAIVTLDSMYYAQSKDQEAIAINASSPILVMQTLADETATQRKYASSLLPPIPRFEAEYQFTLSQGFTYTFALLMATEYRNSFLFNNRPQQVQWATSPPQSGVPYSVGFLTTNGGSMRISSAGGAPVGVYYFAKPNGGAQNSIIGSSLGIKMPKRRCFPCKGIDCDVKDHDCDGFNNEEACDKIDNDGDGLVDEDCCIFTPTDIRSGQTPAAESTQTIGGIVAGSIIGLGMIGGLVALIVAGDPNAQKT